jgi:hypothetical protein
MVRRKLNRFIPVGLLLLCVGITLRSWMHTRYSAFAAGFLWESRSYSSLPALCSSVVPFRDSHLAQSSILSCFTRWNTRSWVTSIASAARAWAAIIMSKLPMGAPESSSVVRSVV